MLDRLLRTYFFQFIHEYGFDPASQDSAHLHTLDPRTTSFSAQALYREIREYEGHPNEDDGGQIRSIVNRVATLGDCLEATDPYRDTGWIIPLTPNQRAEAFNFRVLGGYNRLRAVDDVKACLFSGYTGVLGFAVYPSFERIGPDGLMPIPGDNEPNLGGHAVHFVGWDDNVRCPKTQFPGALEIQNSWGASWGKEGRFYMPYEFAANTDWCWDIWTIRMPA